MRLTFLGTGTSTGVPQLCCDCPTCTSADRRDRRMRCSAMVVTADKTILIDCGPDFYFQMLNYHRSKPIDAALLTHSHYDHVGGIDDLRPYCESKPDGFPLYCQDDVSRDLHDRVPYCFKENPYPGVPHYEMHIISAGETFHVGTTPITAVRVMHAALPILGFIFGRNLAYITDAKTIPAETISALRGIDTLVINSLRIEEHHSHMNLRETSDVIEMIRPRKAYLTHLSHQMGKHAEASAMLPENVEIATDGLTIFIPD